MKKNSHIPSDDCVQCAWTECLINYLKGENALLQSFIHAGKRKEAKTTTTATAEKPGNFLFLQGIFFVLSSIHVSCVLFPAIYLIEFLDSQKSGRQLSMGGQFIWLKCYFKDLVCRPPQKKKNCAFPFLHFTLMKFSNEMRPTHLFGWGIMNDGLWSNHN